LYRAHRRGKLEWVLVFLGGELRRCQACRVRFVRWRKKVIYPDRARGTLRRVQQWTLVLAGMVMVVVVLLWLVNRESGSPPQVG
jgi:hypothetical protein